MSRYFDDEERYLDRVQDAQDFQDGFIAGLGIDPMTAKMVSDCASDPNCTDAAIKISDNMWAKAIATRDAIGDAAKSVWGQITGDSRDARRKKRKQQAMVRGVHYRNTFGPLYNQCFGVSDWFQNTRHPPKGDPKKADPLACCALIDIYRRAFTAPESKWLGKISGYSIRMENNFRAEHLTNPHLYMDPAYGGSMGYAYNDSDRYGVNNFCFSKKNPDGSLCVMFDSKGFGCGAPDQRPFCKDANEEKAALVRNHCRIKAKPAPKPAASKPKPTTYKPKPKPKPTFQAFRSTLAPQPKVNPVAIAGFGALVIGAAGFIIYKRRK